MATFDQRLFDRAQDAFTLANKEPVQQKVMVFIVPSKVKLGVVGTEIRFPYNGVISDIYASCGMVGLQNTLIDIEKCNQIDYDTNPMWTSIFYKPLSIDANEKSSNSSAMPYALAVSKVNKNDHFRVNITALGIGIEDITVEIIINI